jgi:hypothetical protein
MRNKVLSFILAFLTFIGVANAETPSIKLSKPDMSWGWESDGSDKKVQLKLNSEKPANVPSENLFLEHVAYDGALNPLDGEITSRKASEFAIGVKWTYEGDPAKSMPLYRYRLNANSVYSAFGPSAESLAVFNGEKLHLDGGITVDGEPLVDGQTVNVGQTVRFKQEVALAANGPFLSDLKIGTISAATPGTTVDNAKVEDGYLSFTIPASVAGKEMQINLIAALESGMDKYFETSKLITLKVNKFNIKLPTPRVRWRMPGGTEEFDRYKTVELVVTFPLGTTLPEGLTYDDIKVQEISYNSRLELNAPVESLKSLKSFDNGYRWEMGRDGDPYTDCPLYQIRLCADAYQPSDPVLVSFMNEKVKLPTPEVWVNGVLVEDDGSVTVTHDVPFGSKVSVRKRDGILPGFKNDIMDFPARQIATSHVYYREWRDVVGSENNVEIDIPQTEEGDKSYFIVDESLVGKKIFHRHLYTPNEDYKKIFEESDRTPCHTMVMKGKGKLNITGTYSQNKDNPVLMDMSIAASGYADNEKDGTLHYIEYYSESTLSAPYLPSYSSNKASAKGNVFTCQYANYGGTGAPEFLAAYASAPGYEDSDVLYFKAEGEELKIESPRVYVNGELVAHAELSQDDLTIPLGAEVRIENPNVYTPATVRTRAAEDEPAPFETCFGVPQYSNLPSGVTPDSSGNVTFTANEAGQYIPLELMLIPTSGAFTKWDPTICHLIVNTQTGVEDIDSESNVHEEIYTINGVRVTGKKLQKGVYVVVRNGKATKKVI